MDGGLYDGSNLLSTGAYTLTDDSPASGTIVVGKAAGLLNRAYLTLRQANGEEISIIPRRVEHSVYGGAILLFDVAP